MHSFASLESKRFGGNRPHRRAVPQSVLISTCNSQTAGTKVPRRGQPDRTKIGAQMDGKLLIFKEFPRRVFWIAAMLSYSLPGLCQQSSPESTNEGMTLYELLKAGGWTMVPLALLSLLALGLIFYFFFALTQRRLMPNDLLLQLRGLARDARWEDVYRICNVTRGPLPSMIMSGIRQAEIDPNNIVEAMQNAGDRELQKIMRQVRYLSEVATIAPLLGLLGTVLGMIDAFSFIAVDISMAKPVTLAMAVAKALVTTAVGLIIAIPAMAFYFYFRGRVQSIFSRIEEAAQELADRIRQEPPGRR